MSKKVINYAVSDYLYDLTEKQVVTLDQEATDGAGWNLYCQSYINRPTVFKNKISGRFRNIEQDYYVEVKVEERQITTFCSTCRNGEICIHSVALLYSWIYDHDAFLNVAESIRRLESRNKDELIEIIAQILSKDAGHIEYLFETRDEEGDYDLDGMLN